MLRFAIVVVSLVVFGACDKDNPQSCELMANAGKMECADSNLIPPPDTEPVDEKCTTSDECTSAPALVCDPNNNGGTCVQCTTSDSTHCMGTTPLCTNSVCTACTQHSDCVESNTCLPDGSCAASTDVAYVDGDNGMPNAPCTKAEPCTRLEDAAAKSIIKVVGTVKSKAVLNNVTARIFAEPGAKLAPTDSDSNAALELRGNSNLEIYDLLITKTANSNANGVVLADMAVLNMTRVTIGPNAANGIGVTNNAQLTCTQCTITGNLARGIDAAAGTTTVIRSTIKDNAGGGIRMSGTAAFHIIGNVIWRNGQLNKGGSGGVFIFVDSKPAGEPPNELDFNSISHNITLDPSNTKGNGVDCTSGTDFVATNNIIWNNALMTSLQVSNAGCSYASSNIGPNATGSGANLSENPQFVDEDAGDLHLKKTSPMIGTAADSADLTGPAALDIDGDTRARPADIGADYVLPRPTAAFAP